jgi:transposase
MTAPGVGPVVALTYRACVDNPARFGRSKCVGAHYGLTPRLYQSGETARIGRVSKCGDAMMRAALYEAAFVLLTGPRNSWSSLKAWGIAVAKRRGMPQGSRINPIYPYNRCTGGLSDPNFRPAKQRFRSPDLPKTGAV